MGLAAAPVSPPSIPEYPRRKTTYAGGLAPGRRSEAFCAPSRINARRRPSSDGRSEAPGQAPFLPRSRLLSDNPRRDISKALPGRGAAALQNHGDFRSSQCVPGETAGFALARGGQDGKTPSWPRLRIQFATPSSCSTSSREYVRLLPALKSSRRFSARYISSRSSRCSVMASRI